ncbi:MAG: transcription termination/antitermination protein NusG [Candidatus Gracilibacteria bacterium]|nr:transcription termination/antitermination protein NusG [Candidatus Gracilibacteria bacterium]
MFDFSKKELGEWYVIRVISGTEENVRQSLMQRREAFGLEQYILDVFVPTHDSVSIRAGGKKVQRKKNIFPGYILVQMVVTNESWYIVRNTPNVTGFLGAGTVPVPVRGEELEQLKGILTEKSEEYNTDMQIGDYVVVKNGPFEGSEGKIIEVNTSKGTIKIMINLLGRDTPVEIEFGSVKSKK